MKKIIYKLYKFMYGRYGIDDLYKLVLILCISISFINIFINSKILTIVETLLIIILIYRSMSKNISKRETENNKYLKLKKNIKNRVNLLKRKWNDRNTHMYKKCPKCKTTLRLPLKKGKHTCSCPKCHNKFKIRCYKNEKIRVEVVKNK